MRHRYSALLVYIVTVATSGCTEDLAKSETCSVSQAPTVGLVLEDLPTILAPTGLHIGITDTTSLPPTLTLYENNVSEAIAVLEYQTSNLEEAVSLDSAIRLQSRSGEPEQMWDLNVIGPGGIRGLVVSDKGWDRSLVLMSRRSTENLRSIVSKIRLSPDTIELEDFVESARHRSPHVPGIGSVPLSPFAEIRAISYTNQHLRSESEPQIAVALGIAKTCGDQSPLEIYAWWFGPFERPFLPTEPGTISVQYPSPALYGDVLHEVWLVDEKHLATMTAYGLEPVEFDRLRRSVISVSADEQEEAVPQ